MRWISLCVLVAVAACRREPAPESPDEAYRAFVSAVEQAHDGREPTGLLESFDAPTRAALTARAQAAAKQAGDESAADPAYQLVAGGAQTPALADVTVESSSADAATLRVKLDGGATESVKMVREAGRWRVHLDALPGG